MWNHQNIIVHYWLFAIVRQPNPKICESGKKLGKVLLFGFLDSLNPIQWRHKQWRSATVQENVLLAIEDLASFWPVFATELPQNGPPQENEKSNFHLVSSSVSPKHILWSYKFDGRKIRSFASCLGKNERRYQLKLLLFHFLRGVQFRADLGQKQAKYSIANKFFS